jgi:hypothetical protein
MNLYEVIIDRRVKPKDDPDRDTQTSFKIPSRSLVDARKKATQLIRTSYPDYFIITVKRHW